MILQSLIVFLLPEDCASFAVKKPHNQHELFLVANDAIPLTKKTDTKKKIKTEDRKQQTSQKKR